MKIKILFLTLLLIAASACKKSGAAGATGDAGCSDLDANSARMRCLNNNVEFCSSYSKYKWMETQKCPSDKACFISPDGKSGGCK
ncbi:MAG: hypothetical protein J0L53_09640 [Spirochaetes bacterium]|nr:hypothetical protein [Spirochaetota bacterium]MBX3722840.1 hypothetical protein [Turneriella sp.]